ncbi:glycosyltransferase family 39 protein [Thalassoglobus sp. JC818]|uniref:glycosyltransferase family 39 protein n=1 Tax=Thalassoglobus sp. JC818 TaxID=3232136 RepID=UPI003459ADD2
MEKRSHFVFLVAALVAITVLLRMDGIATRSIWLDEAFSWGISARSTWSEILSLTARDTHPPFYYYVLKLWISVFGESVIALRSLSIFCAGLSTTGLALLCRDVINVESEAQEVSSNQQWAVVVLACLLFALNPTHCQWSQEARMYSLATMLAIWGSWFLLQALTHPAKPTRWWSLYVLSTLALLYTHHYAMFTVFAQGLVAAWASLAIPPSLDDNLTTTSRPKLHYVGVSFALIIAGYLPWIPVLRSQISRVQESFWIPKVTVWSVPDAWFSALFSANSPPELKSHFLALLVTNLTAIVWIQFLIPGRKIGRVLTFALGIAPLVCATAVSLTTVSILTSRHLILCLPFFYVAFSIVVSTGTILKLRPLVFVMILINAAAVLSMSRESLQLDSRTGLNAAVDTLHEQIEPGDQIVVVHPAMFYSFWHCTQHEFDRPELLDLGEIDHFMGSSILSDDIKVTRGELLSRGSQRMWTIDSSGYSRPYSGPQEKLFQDSWIKILESRFLEPYYFQGSVVLTLYKRIPIDDSKTEGSTKLSTSSQ